MLALVTSILAVLPGSVVVRDWLVIPPVDRGGRRPFAPNAVFERHVLTSDLAPPKVGETLTGERGEEKAWIAQSAGEDGSLGGEIGWAYAQVESTERRVVMAKLTGAGRLFVNGAGFPGDLYAYGFGGVPVQLAKGANHVYVSGVRGSFRLDLVDIAGPVVAGSWDHVVPDLVRGEYNGIPSLGVLVWNASDVAREITAEGVMGIAPTTAETYSDAMTIEPGAAWRFSVPIATDGFDRTAQTTWTVRVALKAKDFSVEERVEIPVRAKGEARRVGFTSAIDGSLQTYALLPFQNERPLAAFWILLSLHGAGVDALNQARSYSAKHDISVVCPTNRRPFGFDWQDWGRLDAYEALDHHLAGMRSRVVQSFGMARVDAGLPHDPDEARKRSRIVLTGHSMGGHGTWSLAANDPEAFDGVGPSAGWASFDSYGGRPEGALKELWLGADFASKTEDLAANLVPLPTFVLHGTADDNVPPSEARDMIALLEKLGGKPKFHFQEGAGHWWDGELSAGADCVDHPGILALFDAKTEGDEYEFDWISADPGVDARHRFVEVRQPLVYGRPFRVTAKRGEDGRTIQIETDNVRVLKIAPSRTHFLFVTIDGRSTGTRWPANENWELTAEGWGRVAGPVAGKSPDACGPFKRAFDRRFVLVFGTSGDVNEDRELFERARHDHLTWWYRANATPRLVSDVQFVAEGFNGRNVILYGNRDTNAAWAKLCRADGPVDARRGTLRLGAKTWKGDDLGAVFVLPRADDGVGLVGAFADTGPRGTRLGYTLAPFVSGVGYPDYAVFSSAILSSGDGGVLAAGWFDRNWGYDAKQFVKPD